MLLSRRQYIWYATVCKSEVEEAVEEYDMSMEETAEEVNGASIFDMCCVGQVCTCRKFHANAGRQREFFAVRSGGREMNEMMVTMKGLMIMCCIRQV